MSLQNSYQEYRKIEKKNALSVGQFRLLDNPNFCADFLSFTAEKKGEFPSFEKWLNFLNKPYKLPEKPDKNNPYLYKNTAYRYADHTKAKVYRSYIYIKKLEKYQQKALKIQDKKDKQAHLINQYNVDKKGYCQYVFERLSEADKTFLSDFQAFYINESEREKHSYISGSTGSGKSELLKIFLHNYIKNNPDTAIILIDPHGKIADEVGRFKENADNDRLITINTQKKQGKNIVLNPFSQDKTEVTTQSIDIAVQELTGAFKEILQDSGFTPQMETLIKPCIATLLLLPNANLYHLQQFMNEDENHDLLLFAQRNLKNPAQKHFLKHDFLKSSYAPSRQSIATKIQSLLNSQVFIDFVIGENSFSLKKAIEEKKIILFNLSRQSGVETSDTIGRLLLSSLQALAMQRDPNNSSPIHLFIDECQHYITPSIEIILTEARKYKLYLTLANQFESQIRKKIIKDAIQGNTNIKATGRQTESNTLAEIKRGMGIEKEAVKSLKVGEYYIKIAHYEAVKIKTTDSLVDNNHAMTAKQWEEIEQQQIKQYYSKNTNTLFEPPQVESESHSHKKGLN